MATQSRVRTIGTGAAVVAVVIVATAFAIGGGSSPRVGSAGQQSHVTNSLGLAPASRSVGHGTREFSSAKSASTNGNAPVPVVAAVPVTAPAGNTGSTASSSGATSAGGSTAVVNDASTATGTSSSGLGATRVVKTGSLSLTVAKGQVASTVARLVGLGTQVGGYVASSETASIDKSPSGEVVLRIPVDKFDSTVAAAEKLGKEQSLQTDAQDVTGKYVDLQARLGVLQHARTTYLTILGRARSIGQTLNVQQRVDDIQSQIEQLQGKIKLLRNQSTDGTLTIDVNQVGATQNVTPVHHKRHGLGLAWHNSIDRFNRGIDAIVGALGPLLLALLLLSVAYVVIRVGTRGSRRTTGVAAN